MQAHGHARHQQQDGNGGVHPFVQLSVAQQNAQSHGFHNEQHGGGGHVAVGHDLRTVGRKAVECARDHVRKGGDYQNAEQPAEQKKQLFAPFADVFFNDVADGAALVFHRGVHGREVLHGAEEHAADEHPQKHRYPAEHRGLDGAVDGARACDGGELVAEDHVGVRRFIVHAVFEFVGGCFCVGVDAPGFRQPAAIDQIAGAQHDDGDAHHDESVHIDSLSR